MKWWQLLLSLSSNDRLELVRRFLRLGEKFLKNILFFKNHFTTKKIKNKIGAPIERVLKNLGLLLRSSQTNSNCKLNDKKIRLKSIKRSTILSAIIVPNNFSKGIFS